MSDSRCEATRAGEQKAEGRSLSLGWAPYFAEIPKANRRQGDGSEAVSSVGHGQRQERRMRSAGCRPHRMLRMHKMHRMRGHSCQLGAAQKKPGGKRKREASCKGQDQRAFFPGCQFEDGEAAAGSGPAESSGAEVLSQGAGLSPPSSARAVPEPSQDVEDAPRRPELAADCQSSRRRPCRWAAWLELELGPSCSSYPDLGPYEWSPGRRSSTFPWMERRPTCRRARRC